MDYYVFGWTFDWNGEYAFSTLPGIWNKMYLKSSISCDHGNVCVYKAQTLQVGDPDREAKTET